MRPRLSSAALLTIAADSVDLHGKIRSKEEGKCKMLANCTVVEMLDLRIFLRRT